MVYLKKEISARVKGVGLKPTLSFVSVHAKGAV